MHNKNEFGVTANTYTHTYNHEKAQQVYQGTLIFINDARALLASLDARNGWLSVGWYSPWPVDHCE